MSVPLSFMRSQTTPSLVEGVSLGDVLAEQIINSNVNSLLDCLCSSPEPAIISPDVSRPPLTHDLLYAFASDFFLPNSTARLPLGPNDRIMIVLPTGPENALALMSMACYHTCAPVNASCTAAELREDAQRLNAKAIITTKDVEKRLELVRLQEELDCEVIFVEGRESGPAGLFDMSVMGQRDSGRRGPSPPHGLDDQSLVLHTSGTSGKKKVVPYSLLSLLVGTWAVVHSWDLQTSDVNMNMMPLFHVGGIVRNLLAPMLSGGSAVMCAGFDAIAFWNLATEFKTTWYYAAPTIHQAILTSQPDNIDPSRDLAIRMICNAAGGLLPSLAVQLRERFSGATVLPSYGMTECMPIATPPQSYQLERPGCSGVACGPHMSIRDPSNLEAELPRGKTGAVSVRGLPTFEGYETSPDPNVPLDTSAFTSEGWFDSGDVGYMDEDGYLYITGRSKEIINKGGEVISPFEVEEAIVTAAKEYVKTTLAFAVEHDVLQEAIGVVIVPAPGKPRIGLAQLLDLLRDHLHPSKWPFVVVYMADLPKNSAGKPLRIKLATRLNIGRLSDDVPAIQRHFEAEVPHPLASLSDPIASSGVSIDLRGLERLIRSTQEVTDVALRQRSDNIDAFISTTPNCDLTPAILKDYLARYVPGYSVPESIYLFSRPLLRQPSGDVDFASMEAEVVRQNASVMSKEELLVRDIVAELLQIESGMIMGESDFFLLGGSSLLLGKLVYSIRKATTVSIPVATVFTNSTISGIAALVKAEMPNRPDSPADTLRGEKLYSSNASSRSSITLHDPTYDVESIQFHGKGRPRSQNHPLCLIVQAIPFIFFYPMKTAFTWTMLLFVLTYFSQIISDNFFVRMGALLAAIVAGRVATRIAAPIASIVFKWIVIGKYRPGTYQMWSGYYLRWWIVNQSIRAAGRGIFAMHPSLEILYYRLLGADIGSNVHIDKGAKLGEFDLLHLRDGCRISATLLRGFCVERDGFFRLEDITVGRNATINTFTQLSPGAVIMDNQVYGPHASSLEDPSPPSYAAYSRSLNPEPQFLLKLFVAWPIIFLVNFIAYIPWFAIIFLMVDQTFINTDNLNAMEAVIFWFSDTKRVLFHALSRVVRAIIIPILQVALGIMVKRIFGLNKECNASEYTQLMLLRRYINGSLLSRSKLKGAFSVVGTHYEVVSVVYRLMGAKIGSHVYWPGSGIECPDPELLDIGNDVVFGSRSEIYTTDSLGTGKIVVEDGAMIADRVVLLPGTWIGRQTVMGSGAMGRRGGHYEDGSTWMGNDRGEAICFNKGPKEKDRNSDTTTPFGRAFYKRQAEYFVFPYALILLYHILIASASAAYWSISAVSAAQLLRSFHLHFSYLNLFAPRWYRLGIFYGLIASFFIIVLNLQGILALLWVIATKWLVIRRRKAGPCEWDKSSYCQRWQLHLVLSRPIYKGYGNGGVLTPLTGSAYIVWFYRALGAKIGKNCCIYAGGKTGLMTEPDLVELGSYVSLDSCSVVAHINSRGNFALNALKLSHGCAMRNGSRLLSGASMEDSSMLCEHTLLTSGEVAEAGCQYVGWPGKRVDESFNPKRTDVDKANDSVIMCPMCQGHLRLPTATPCGHLFCESCIRRAIGVQGNCPVCMEAVTPESLLSIKAGTMNWGS